MRTRYFLPVVMTLAFAVAGAPMGTGPAFAQNAQDLVRSLSKSKPKMRGFHAPNAKEQRVRGLVKSIQTGKTRQITVEERTEVAEYVKESDLPSIDIEVFFEYDSAAITPAATPKLQTLGKALSDAKLKGKTFMIAGHTDATGSDAYNLSLSKRRGGVSEAISRRQLQTRRENAGSFRLWRGTAQASRTTGCGRESPRPGGESGGGIE